MHSNFDNPSSRAWLPPPLDPQIGKIVMNYEELRDLGISYSKEHLRRLEADGLFPTRVRLSVTRVAWLYDEVIAWISDRAENRQGALQMESGDEQFQR